MTQITNISGISFAVEVMQTNGIQATYRFAVGPQTQDKSLLVKAQAVAPILCQALELEFQSATPAVPATPKLAE